MKNFLDWFQGPVRVEALVRWIIFFLCGFGLQTWAQTAEGTPETLATAWSAALGVDHLLREAANATAAVNDEFGATKDSHLPTLTTQGVYTVLDHDPTATESCPRHLPSTLTESLASDHMGITNLMVSAPVFTSAQIHHTIAVATSAMKATQEDQRRFALMRNTCSGLYGIQFLSFVG